MTSQAVDLHALARSKRLALWGCLTLFVVAPLLLGGWISVAVRLAGAHPGAVAYAGMLVWALACLAALILGFAFFLGGVYLWWRARHAGPIRAVRSSDDDRVAALRELRDRLRRDEPSEAGAVIVDDDSSAPGARR